MTREQAVIVADYRAGLLGQWDAHLLLAQTGERDPLAVLHPHDAPTGSAPQGWDAVYRRSA